MSESQQVPKPELDLLELYITQVRNHFEVLDSAQRWKFLTRFRTLTGPRVPKPGFDGIQAKEIRRKLGLTRKALVTKWGMHEVTLYKYEAGLLVPDLNNKPAKCYIRWLKRHGFKSPEVASK